MKNRNPLAILAVLLTALLGVGAARAADILPNVVISFAPVGVAEGQTVELHMVNVAQPNPISVTARFFDDSGNVLNQQTLQLVEGKTNTIDFKPGRIDFPRVTVRSDIEILTPGVPETSIRRSQEVFDDATGVSRVVMGGGGTMF